MRVHRLISILMLIEARGSIKAKELASKMEVSLRTIYRDIDIMCEAGIPILTTTGPNGGIHLMEGWTGGFSLLEEEEIINLYLGGIGVIPNNQSEMATKINNVLLKLEMGLSEKQSEDLKQMKKKLHFDENPWWGKDEKLHHIDLLFHCTFNSKVIKLEYKKVTGEKRIRRVHPYGIVVKGRIDWYMIAYCEVSGSVRTFKCNRIVECVALNEDFSPPEDFSLEEYWNKSEETFKNQCKEKEQFPVVIKVDKDNGHLLTTLEVFEVIEGIDHIEATINMYDLQYAKENIIKMVGLVEVIKPKELRAFVEKQLDTIVMKYKEK